MSLLFSALLIYEVFFDESEEHRHGVEYLFILIRSRGYEIIDAETYAYWGIDYVKDDSCWVRSLK